MEKESNVGFGVESFKFSFSYSAPRRLLDSIMNSAIVRLLGGLVCVILAFVFGVMFIIGSVDLLKSKKSTESVVATKNQNAITEENEEETIIEEVE